MFDSRLVNIFKNDKLQRSKYKHGIIRKCEYNISTFFCNHFDSNKLEITKKEKVFRGKKTNLLSEILKTSSNKYVD